ncbi:MAG: EAL domain-containing protein [Ilumatobacteraceae bacterium]
MSDRSARSRRASFRIGRFGPRSLAARLLVVVLVPMLGLQVFAFREVQQQRRAAESAAEVRAQVSLLQQSGRVIAPLYVEFIATDGLTRSEEIGVDRTVLADIIGVDLLSLLVDARTELSAGLASLSTATAGLVLPSGLASEQVAGIQRDLSNLRGQFDSHRQTSDEVQRVFTRIIAFTEEIAVSSAASFEQSATTRQLADIGDETVQLLTTLGYAATELHLIAEASIAGGNQPLVIDSVASAGAFQASLERLRGMLSGHRRDDLEALVTSPSFAQVDAAMSPWMLNISGVPSPNGELIDDTATVRSMVDLLTASFARLKALQTYGDTFLADQVQRAAAIEAKAESNRTTAVKVMIAAIGISLVLLGLVLLSILRPLRRLTRQSRQVGDGDLALAPVKPTGPTDIRVMMRTFNEMVTTLRAYDAQVRRLALGETQIDRTLPGPLGDTLRQSVSHLAAVTAKLHASEAAANIQARTDSLTGLANRPAALEHLARMSLEARYDEVLGAVVFLDLDGFKSVNDTQGHGEGDRILGEIGTRLKEACPDKLVARLGGDEFIVLIDRIADQADVTELAHRLIDIVSAPCTGSSGQLFAISASAGISIVDGSREPLDCIAQADSAVYHAKESGRGRVEVYDARLARDIEDRADMALTMRQGISGDQFAIKLQPIIDIATKQPVGAEALLRWNRPGFGEVGPDEFIPVAERTGVILDLDAWVLEQSVGVLRQWQNDPLTAQLRIAVNISGRHIIDGTLSPLLDQLCSQASVDPGMIDLEITETHLVADVARASAVVDDLRRQGVKVAIDDFGTGYSSMGYLHQLTVDTLKIDRVFVGGMCDNPLDRTIVELLLRLGDSLGLKVVAEGVDSEQKLIDLLALGCPMAQGYYIARPMPVDDATVWLRQQVTLASLL